MGSKKKGREGKPIMAGEAASFLKAINALSPPMCKRHCRDLGQHEQGSPALLKKFVFVGEGCTTTTSMPRLRTSGAIDAANMVMKALVLEYMALRGLGTKPELEKAIKSNKELMKVDERQQEQ